MTKGVEMRTVLLLTPLLALLCPVTRAAPPPTEAEPIYDDEGRRIVRIDGEVFLGTMATMCFLACLCYRINDYFNRRADEREERDRHDKEEAARAERERRRAAAAAERGALPEAEAVPQRRKTPVRDKAANAVHRVESDPNPRRRSSVAQFQLNPNFLAEGAKRGSVALPRIESVQDMEIRNRMNDELYHLPPPRQRKRKDSFHPSVTAATEKERLETLQRERQSRRESGRSKPLPRSASDGSILEAVTEERRRKGKSRRSKHKHHSKSRATAALYAQHATPEEKRLASERRRKQRKKRRKHKASRLPSMPEEGEAVGTAMGELPEKEEEEEEAALEPAVDPMSTVDGYVAALGGFDERTGLPAGWAVTESHSHPGEVVYENRYNGDRVAWMPPVNLSQSTFTHWGTDPHRPSAP